MPAPAATPTSPRRGRPMQVARWYGPKRRQEAHFGEAFAAARAGRPQALETLARLAVDAAQPPIVRASALAELRADGSAGIAERIQATRDADPEVRAAAADSLDAVPAAQRLYALAPLLSDPVRAVRIAAARGLSSLPPDQLAAQRAGLRRGVGRIHRGTKRVARHAGRAAQPGGGPSKHRSARRRRAALPAGVEDRPRLHAGARQPGPAVQPHGAQRRRRACADRGARARAHDRRTAVFAGPAARRRKTHRPKPPRHSPRRPSCCPSARGFTTTSAWPCSNWGGAKPAEAALLQAQRLDPRDAATCYALAVFYAQGRQYAQALPWAEKLLALDPTNAQATQLVSELRGRQ